MIQIIVLSAILVFVEGNVEKCCEKGYLYLDKQGKFSCANMELTTLINRDFVNLTLPITLCPFIGTPNNIKIINKCKSGRTCKDTIFDENSKSEFYAKIDFSPPIIKTKYEVKKCCPRGNFVVARGDEMSYFCVPGPNPQTVLTPNQDRNVAYIDSLNNYCERHAVIKSNDMFIEEPFLDSPLRDHPMVQVLRNKSESLNYCVHNHFDEHVFLICDEDSTRYESMKKALNVMKSESEQQIFVCNEKYDSTLANVTMSASPLNLGDLRQFMPLLTETHKKSLYEDDDQFDSPIDKDGIIASMIRRGKQSGYWDQHKTKFNCSKGIRKYEPVSVTDSGDLYGDKEKITRDGGLYCLSLSEESLNNVDAYSCEGYSG